MKITLFQRNSSEGFSIENITKNIHNNLPKGTISKIYTTKYTNKGILNKFKSIFEVRKYQKDINHITGEVHYLDFLLKKDKTIVTMHDCERIMGNYFNPLRKLINTLFYFTIPSWRCKYITTISKESKKNLVKYTHINPKKIKVIYDGVDTIFQKIKFTKKQKNNLLNNKNNKITLLHVGKSKKNKNLVRIIKSIKNLNVKFVKIGEFSKKELFLLQKYNLDCVNFINIDFEFLVEIYNSVDCLVFPSTIEGFGLPIVEAQKCGCPVITSNCSSMPEIGGKGAYYVNPFSVESIKEGIETVISNKKLQNKLIKNGFENAKRFEWKNIANEYYKLYQRIK